MVRDRDREHLDALRDRARFMDDVVVPWTTPIAMSFSDLVATVQRPPARCRATGVDTAALRSRASRMAERSASMRRTAQHNPTHVPGTR